MQNNIREKTQKPQAEEFFKKKEEQSLSDTVITLLEKVQQRLQKLKIQKLELEIQNEELQCTQEEMAETREHYFNLYDRAPVGYCTISEKGMILRANITATNTLGMVRGTLTKQLLSQFIFEDDRGIYNANRHQLLLTGEPQECELRMVKKDGTVFWAHIKANIVRSANILNVCRVVLVDITKQKQIEAELLEAKKEALRSHEQLRSITDNAGSIIYLKGLDGTYIHVNRLFEELFNVKNVDIQGKTAYNIFQQEIAANFNRNERTVIENGKSLNIEEKVMCGGRACTYLSSLFPLKTEQGEIYAIGGISTDITVRKQAEESLQSSLSLLETMLEATADGILVVDRKGKIAKYNQQFADMWGIEKGLLLDYNGEDEPVLNYVVSQMAEPKGFLTKVKELYRKPAAKSLDVLYLADGRIFERYSQPQRLGAEIVGRVWSFRDVTANKKVEREVQQVNRQLEEALAELNKLSVIAKARE